MSKLKSVHRTGALGMLMAEGGLPTVNNTGIKNRKEPADYLLSKDQYTEIDPLLIRNWALNDRPETELGDIAAFAKELAEVGQQQPCIVRPIDDKEFSYEVIAGERRWRAAKQAKIKLKVIIRALNDHDAAIAQAAENAQRKDLSDYAKGMSFYSLLKQGVLTREEIENKLGISTAQVSRLLSFADLPTEVNEAIHDFSLVTARTAAEIRSIANKGQRHIAALIKLAKKISSGTIGGKKLQSQVEKILSLDSAPEPVIKKVYSANKKPLFTWKQTSKHNLTISLSKEVLSSLNGNHQALEHEIANCLEKMINNH